MLTRAQQNTIRRLGNRGETIPAIAKETGLIQSVVGAFLFSRQIPRAWDYGQRTHLAHILYLGANPQAKTLNEKFLDERAIRDPSLGVVLVRLARLSVDNDTWAYKWNLLSLGTPAVQPTSTDRPNFWVLFSFAANHASCLLVPYAELHEQKSVTVLADRGGRIADSSPYKQFERAAMVNPMVRTAFARDPLATRATAQRRA